MIFLNSAFYLKYIFHISSNKTTFEVPKPCSVFFFIACLICFLNHFPGSVWIITFLVLFA
jgi:hypothetical protein